MHPKLPSSALLGSSNISVLTNRQLYHLQTKDGGHVLACKPQPCFHPRSFCRLLGSFWGSRPWGCGALAWSILASKHVRQLQWSGEQVGWGFFQALGLSLEIGRQ